MRRVKGCAAGLIAVTLGMLLVLGASAEGPVTPTPDQISITAGRGTIETRTLLLHATDPITDLQMVPLDLPRTDGKNVLPAGAIRVDLPSDEISSNGLLTIPVTVDLHDVPSGTFRGSLLVRYHGGTFTIPTTVTVKDRWLVPLAVLLVGIGLGVGVSVYRAKGRPRDAVLMRVGRLQAEMRGDPELAKPFKTRIENHLIDVEATLQEEKWQEARDVVGKAEAIWIRWRKGRDDWLEQLAYQPRLMEKLRGEPDVPYIQALRRSLEDALRQASDMEGPHQLRERLDEIAQQINRYLRLRGLLDQLLELRMDLSDEEARQWSFRIQAFERRLYDLAPDDTQAYKTLQSDMEEALVEITQEIQLASEALEMLGPAKSPADKGARGVGARVLELLASPPATREITEETTTNARIRRRLFTWASYVIMVILLVGAGFRELYVANETFGANAWGDYFALLAWGFGAEASRAAIVEMARGWGLAKLE